MLDVKNELMKLFEDKNNIEAMASCARELEGRLEESLQLFTPEDEPVAYNQTKEMYIFTNKLLRLFEKKDERLFKTVFTKELLEEKGVTPYDIKGIRYYIDVPDDDSFVNEFDSLFYLYTKDDRKIYMKLDFDCNFNNPYNSLEKIFLKDESTFTYRDLFTLIDPELLEIFINNNIEITTDCGIMWINDGSFNLDSNIITGYSYRQ
jgi:hypothetical protein